VIDFLTITMITVCKAAIEIISAKLLNASGGY